MLPATYYVVPEGGHPRSSSAARFFSLNEAKHYANQVKESWPGYPELEVLTCYSVWTTRKRS